MVQAKGLEPSPASLRGKYAANYTTLVHGPGSRNQTYSEGLKVLYAVFTSYLDGASGWN